MNRGFFETARNCLAISGPGEKCAAVLAMAGAAQDRSLSWDESHPFGPLAPPGRPGRPELIDPARVPRRRLGSSEGRAALVHAIAHIEFNAINLALDAVCRFPGMPRQYYFDWLSVAED